MAMQFEYDEDKGTFFYFLLSFWALLLLPATYYLWPPKKSKDEEERLRKICQCIPCQVKRQRLNVNEAWIKTREKAMKIGLMIGWVVFILLAYKVSIIQLEHVEYDPYAVLEIDQGASQSEVKKAYHKLSLKFHPDKVTGDEKKFMRITKAYAALTDEETKKNWEEYGNPDGPGVTKFGIALPKWMIKEGNFWVLASYGVIFMVILPVIVGTWWYRSIKFNKNQVLLETSHMYYDFFHKTSNAILKKVILVLAASKEFDKEHNPQIVERPSDNEEVPELMKMLPDLDAKKKYKPYICKAQALLHSQFHRVKLPISTLEIDRLYILKKCPALIKEMINIISGLVAMAYAEHRDAKRAIQNMPKLDTMENVMKLSPMIIQGVAAKCSSLLQLPHITQDMLRHFVTKKRNVRKIHDLVTMKALDRRLLLRNLNDEEYQHVMNVCRNLPQVKMTVKPEVRDEKDTCITTGSTITVTVTLERKSMAELFEKEFKELDEQGPYINQICAKMYEENEEHAINEGNDKNQEEEETKKTTKVWRNKKKQKKKGGKPAKKEPKKPYQWKKTQPVNDRKPIKETNSQENMKIAVIGTRNIENVDQSESKRVELEEENQSDAEEEKEDEEFNEDDWKKFKEEAKKRNALMSKKIDSHPVHCPYFPEEKQEGWWLYIADKKKRMLISAPVQILSLKTTEEIELMCRAPPKIGYCKYTVILRSDCYVDFNQFCDMKLDVKKNKTVKEHSSDEEENQDNNDDDGTDSDYSTDNDDSE